MEETTTFKFTNFLNRRKRLFWAISLIIAISGGTDIYSKNKQAQEISRLVPTLDLINDRGLQDLDQFKIDNQLFIQNLENTFSNSEIESVITSVEDLRTWLNEKIVSSDYQTIDAYTVSISSNLNEIHCIFRILQNTNSNTLTLSEITRLENAVRLLASGMEKLVETIPIDFENSVYYLLITLIMLLLPALIVSSNIMNSPEILRILNSIYFETEKEKNNDAELKNENPKPKNHSLEELVNGSQESLLGTEFNMGDDGEIQKIKRVFSEQ